MLTGLSYLSLIGIFYSVRLTLQASTPTSPFYIGAAVEYYPITSGDNLTAIANQNVENYIKFLKTAAEKDVDIIVFPENGINSDSSFTSADRTKYIKHSTIVPDPKDTKIPCHDQTIPVSEALKAISCAANRYNMYVVVNIREMEKCTGDKCPKDGYNFYNTNVAFDRTGAIVGRYRKWNLFGEISLNKTPKAELSIFKTDFDVTFGQFICFDILFEEPTLKLIREKKITDIIFSTHWFSELPWLIAPATQSAWSYINNVNFLGSGYNNPATGSTGTGLYAGKTGQIANIITEKRTNAIVIGKIAKINNGKRENVPSDAITIIYSNDEINTITGNEPVPQLKLLADNIMPYTTKLFVPVNGTSNVTICDRGLCCEFKADTLYNEAIIKGSNVKYYRYRFAVFNGIRSFAKKATGGIEICSIISCTTDSINDCTQRFDPNTIVVQPTIFKSLKITANFTTLPNNLYLPIGFNYELNSLNVTDFSFTMSLINKTHTSIKYKLLKSRKDLMTFGIYGRNFTADGQPETLANGVTKSTATLTLIIALIAITNLPISN